MKPKKPANDSVQPACAGACAHEEASHPPPPVYLRVRAIRQHLEAGTWGPEVATQFGEEWGLGPDMVARHAAEAARQLEAIVDALQARRVIGAELECALDMAFDQRDPQAVQRLLESKMKLHGIGAHRDPKNDPKPEAEKPRVPFGFKPKGPPQPS